MAVIQLKVNGAGLIDYAREGKEAAKRVKLAMRVILNKGRTTARQQIASQFRVRTGFLRRQARRLKTNVTVNAMVVKGQVTPLPRLLNIFERGATLAHGRGFLNARPVIGPAKESMEHMAEGALTQVLQQVGR